jgi:hypothetical protein
MGCPFVEKCSFSYGTFKSADPLLEPDPFTEAALCESTILFPNTISELLGSANRLILLAFVEIELPKLSRLRFLEELLI